MKKMIYPMLLVLLVSCSSNKVKDETATSHPMTDTYRDVASSPDCKIVKHPTEDLYNLSMYGKQYNQYWYDELEMELLYQRFVSQGRCD